MKGTQKSSVFKVTQADVKAYQLLHKAGFVQILTNSPHEIIKAGNKIIKLAEQIKAERSAVVMVGERRLDNEKVLRKYRSLPNGLIGSILTHYIQLKEKTT